MQNDPPRPGEPEPLTDGLRRVLAPNPSPMTLHGTNTYLLGKDSLAVIDPGPDDPEHLSALLEAIGGARVSHILVTHAHADHCALARKLSDHCGAPVLGFGPAGSGRSPVMQRMAAAGHLAPGPGLHEGFVPDRSLAHGETIAGEGWALSVLHAPGHTGDHLCFLWEGQAFSGDLVMDWSSTVIAPPEGDLDEFLASCRRLRARAPRRLWPGHGPAVAEPTKRLTDLETHREARSNQLLATLAAGPATLPELARAIYPDLPPSHRPAAEATLLAHLVSLTERGLATATPALAPTARFSLA